ncbi:MAG: DUF6941 family protein [Solirubrobacteraceae bacterium]
MIDEPDDFSIPYMLLADAADAVGGKLYILGGGWDRLMVPNLPARSVKPFAIALGITVPYSHTNRQFVLTIELIDADGAQIGDVLQVGLETGRPPGLRPGGSQNTPLGIGTNPEFPTPGRYSFVARIDGDIKNNVAFEVVPLQQVPFMPSAGAENA